MTHCVVLREKLRVPEATGLARERLEKPLLEGEPTALDVVVAPAGCGKTTLLSRVAAASCMPVGWYRITADDATEHRLVDHLAEALSGLAEIGSANSIAELLGVLDHWSGAGGLLILDDLHEIAESPAEKALERFISLRPRRLQLICGSRRMPEVNVPRIRVSGSFREIGSDDLRFRSWEVEELFTSLYQQPLRPEAAAALTRRTGGWAAGLQLFHLATVGRSAPERHQAVADLGGRSKLVRSYLTRNVLAELPEERREFLLRTCTLGRLSGEACDALLATRGSHHILEELENAQLFTFTDDGGMCFRYHEVLQTHLELALVEEHGAAEAREWYLKSAGLLESLGEARSAARAYAKAGDWVSVSRMVKDTPRIDATVLDDADLLPPSTWQHDPWLALANARRLVREGALQRAADAYRHAQRLYDEPNYQQMCRYESQVVSMWLPGYRAQPLAPAVHSRVAHWSVLLREAIRESPDFAALPTLTSVNDIRVRLIQGMAALTAGEIGLASTLLTSIQREESADTLATISASLALTALDLIEGSDTEDSASHLSTIALLAENEGLPWVSRLCHGLEQIALITSHEATWRFESCSEMVRAADRMGDAWGAGLLCCAAALAKQHVGDDATAEFASAASRFNTLGAPVLELWCRVLAMRDGASESEAHQAVETSRTLRSRGAQAWALNVLASVSPGGRPREMREATELAAQCGIRLPVTQVMDTEGFHTGITASLEVSEPLIPHVAITCFGGYRITIDGQTSTLAQLRPQARWVLQILSLSPDHDQHREFLEDTLWPGVDHSVACHRLQVAVSSVRTAFGQGEVVIRRREKYYRLCLPSTSSVDVRDFTAALSTAATLSARGDLPGRISARQQALDLYTGDLLPELTVSQHVEDERARLRRSAAATAAALASDCRTLGDYEDALSAAQRSVELDPYQEIPWLILADLHDTVGDTSSAEYLRREHARIRAELEIATP